MRGLIARLTSQAAADAEVVARVATVEAEAQQVAAVAAAKRRCNPLFASVLDVSGTLKLRLN